MVQGRNLILAINNTAIAAAKSCSFKIQQNFIEACSPTSGRTKKKIPTDYSWDLSCDCLIATPAYADSIVDMVKNGTVVTIQFYDLTLGLYRYGNAYVANANIDGSVGSLSKLSISLTGSEELNKINWDDVQFTLSSDDQFVSIDSSNSFHYSHRDWYGLYIAIKQNNQYIRWDDGRSGDELSNPIDDDGYLREAHFKGGHRNLYLINGTISGNVIMPKMICSLDIPFIAGLPDSWFVIQCSAWCTDYDESIHGDGQWQIEVEDILIKRA